MAVQILRDTPITTREAAIPFTMVGINMLAATVAAHEMLSPQALLVSLALVVLGVPCSIYFAQRGFKRVLLNLITMLPLLILTWLLIQDLPGLSIDWTSPWESFLGHETSDNLILLLHILVIIAAGRAFSLVTQRDLLQTPIPSVSIFLLSAIIPIRTSSHGLDPVQIACLFVLGVTSLYLLSQAHSQIWFSPHIPVRIQRHLVIWVFVTSLTVFPLVMLCGQSMRSFNLNKLAAYHASRSYKWMHWAKMRGQNYAIGFSDSVEMGGGLWPSSDQIIMQVQVKRGTSHLWRSTSYDFYGGGQWKSAYRRDPAPQLVRTTERETVLEIDPAHEHGDPGIVEALAEKKINLNPKDEKHHLATQSFTILARSIGDSIPIYGAYQIYQFRTGSQQPEAQMHLGADGGVSAVTASFVDKGLGIYEVESIIKPSPAILRLEHPVTLDRNLRISYLQIPDNIRTRVTAKAIDILAARGLTPRSDPLTIIREFESYLGKNYRYTLKPTPPKGQDDPLLDFLVTQKRGYCTYFSGAMVMLCRSINIPARLTVGFATGEENHSKKLDGYTLYEVKAKDAHAWVEVFLPHYGWYTCDPTAGSTEEPDFWGNSWDTLTEMFSIIKNGIANFITMIKQHPHLSAYFSIGIALLLIMAAGLIIWRRERPPKFPLHELSPDEAAALLVQSYHRMHRWLNRWGVTKPKSLTAHEFVGYFREMNPAMGETVGELSALYIRAQYSPAPVNDADARRAIELLHQLWGQWREGHGQFKTAESAE